MKTNFLRRWLGPVWILAGILPPAASAVEPAASTLFMGANLEVKQGKNFYAVEDVDGSEFVVTIDGKKRFIRTRLQSNNIKVVRELKLSPLAVALDNMQGGPGYTPANDPNLKFLARSGAAGGAQAANDLAISQATETANALTAMRQAPIRLVEMEKALEGNLEIQQNQAAVSGYQLQSDYTSIPSQAGDLAKELAEANYDLVDVSFKISSPVPLDDPYMVVLVEFQPRGAKPGEVSMLIHGKALEPITAKPKYIRVREGGMPTGFKYLRHEVHIYNRGKEIASNTSSKRVELNRDEARQYLLLEHMAANKKASVAAAPVPGSLSPEVRLRLQPAQVQRTCYVRVSKEGIPEGVFADASASQSLPDAELSAALAAAYYKPALIDGQPTEGVASVRLVDVTP